MMISAQYVDGLELRISELEAERDRWYGKATERAIELESERDVSSLLENVLKQYHKLTAHDGWYADMVSAALAVASIRSKQRGNG